MMMRSAKFASVIVALAMAIPPNAIAVCLDPDDATLTKYHYPSLLDELVSSTIIAVGTVRLVQPLSGTGEDADSWVAFLYTVDVEELLRGAAEARIVVRTDNDSGGYRMSLGERHLLFLEKRGDFYVADPCGNSTALPKGQRVVDEVRKLLRQAALRPNNSLDGTRGGQ